MMSLVSCLFFLSLDLFLSVCLQALETSTNCFIRMQVIICPLFSWFQFLHFSTSHVFLVSLQGNTIAAMGSFTVSDDSGLLLKHASILEIVLWMSWERWMQVINCPLYLSLSFFFFFLANVALSLSCFPLQGIAAMGLKRWMQRSVHVIVLSVSFFF